MYSSYINALPEPSAQRRMTLKANPSLTFGIAIWNKVTFGASTFDEPQPRSLALLWKHIQKQRSDRLFSNLDCVPALLLGENDAFLIQNASPFLS